MDQNDFENQKENFNSTVTNTNILKKFAQSILKGELENKRPSEELIPDETVSRTKTKRRVSFSAKLCQVKHFDESLIDQAYHSSKNNQDASSDEKHLTDISNKKAECVVVIDDHHCTYDSEPAPKKKSTSSATNANRTLNQTDIFAQSMDFGNNTTYTHFDDDSVLQTNQTMMMMGYTSMNITQGNGTMIDDKSDLTDNISLEENIGSDLLHSIQMANLTATHKNLRNQIATNKNMTKIGMESMVIDDFDDNAGSSVQVSLMDEQQLAAADDNDVEMDSVTKKLTPNQAIKRASCEIVEDEQKSTKQANVTFDLSTGESSDSVHLVNNQTVLKETIKTSSTEQIKETLNVTITVVEKQQIIEQQKQQQQETIIISKDKTFDILSNTVNNITQSIADSTKCIEVNNQTHTVGGKQMSDTFYKMGSGASSMSMLANESINDTEMLKSINAQRIMANESSCELLAEKLKKANVSLYDLNNQSQAAPSTEVGFTSMMGDKSLSYYVPSNFLSNLNMDLASTRALSSGLQINSSVLLGDTSDMEKFDKITNFYADPKLLKEHLTNQLIKFNDLKQKLKDSFNKKKETTNLDELGKRVRSMKEKSEKVENSLIEKRNELSTLRSNALKEPEKLKAFIYNDTWLEKYQSEFKTYSTKNQALEKEYQETNVQYNSLKEKIENNLRKIKSMQEYQKNSQKLQKFWLAVFEQKNIPFNLIAFEHDSFTLSFFNNMILLDVRVPNIFNDLSSIQLDINDEETNDIGSLLHNRKYLNYPIQSISLRTLVDSSGTINYNLLSNYGGKLPTGSKKNEKVPIYIKYCIDLIIGEIATDRDSLTLKKSYKQVKDLSMLINHINLACQNAMNLANDFEYFAEKTQNSKSLKCEFDFQNHILTLNLPSLEDSCFYRLKLKILPGFYYQQPIEYTLEQLEDNFFDPDIKRLGSLIDGHYFENGSLRSYLKRLNFNFS